MNDTPTVYAASEAVGCKYPLDDITAILRAANPWEPLAEEIEAMARAMPPYCPLGEQQAFAAYRARPIMRELYDNDGTPR